MEICKMCHKVGLNFMGEEAALPTNPKKGRTDNHKISMQTVQETRQPVIISEQVYGPR